VRRFEISHQTHPYPALCWDRLPGPGEVPRLEIKPASALAHRSTPAPPAARAMWVDGRCEGKGGVRRAPPVVGKGGRRRTDPRDVRRDAGRQTWFDLSSQHQHSTCHVHTAFPLPVHCQADGAAQSAQRCRRRGNLKNGGAGLTPWASSFCVAASLDERRCYPCDTSTAMCVPSSLSQGLPLLQVEIELAGASALGRLALVA